MRDTLHQLERFRQVVFALFKYGFDDIVERLDLPAKFLVRTETVFSGEKGTYERIRLMFEELGPTFIKIGQVLSVRPDLIPADLTLELRKLQNKVPSVPFEGIKKNVEKTLGLEISAVFSRFDEEPIASASLAQVHKAVLKETNEVVAVKVRKPGIKRIISTDLSVLESIAETLDNRMESFRFYDLPGIVRELKRMLLHELDFGRETLKMRIARANLESFEAYRIPQVYNDYCGERMITMELFLGKTLSEMPREEIHNAEQMGINGLRAMLKQILEDGFFHADPHPGNMLIMESGDESVLLDWGMTGRLTRSMRYKLVDLIEAVVDRDAELITNGLLALVNKDKPPNKQEMERRILEIMEVFVDAPNRRIRVGEMMLEMTGILQEQKIKVPSDLAVMIKAMLTAEGTARMLHPNLDVVAEAEPFVRKAAKERYKPSTILRGFRRSMLDLINLQKSLPSGLLRILQKADEDEFTIRFRHENLTGLRQTLEHITDRLSLAVLVGSGFLGSSLLITTGMEPHIFGYSALGVIGYAISAVFGIWVIITIIRRKNY